MADPTDSDSVLDELYDVIEGRRDGDPKKSYVAKKFAKGTDHIAIMRLAGPVTPVKYWRKACHSPR